MKPRSYEILRRAVEEGIAHGLRRARKHDDSPSDEVIAEQVEAEVMVAVDKVFTFDELDEPEATPSRQTRTWDLGCGALGGLLAVSWTFLTLAAMFAGSWA